jgi:peptidoglycan/LPS O-acetylase OafA/YrhL
MNTIANEQQSIQYATTENKLQHIVFLDGIRALCALVVVYHHWWWEYCYNPPLFNKFYGTLSIGHYAVDVFIVISGFCLMIPVVKYRKIEGGAVNFFLRRAIRILPSYYLAMGLSLLLIATCIGKHTGTHWDLCTPVSWGGVLSHAFLVQDLFFNTCGMINHAFWSISIEWRIYFLFPLLVWVWRKSGIAAMLVVAGWLAANCFYILYSFFRSYVSISLTNPQYILLFGLGMASAYAGLSPDNPKWPKFLNYLLFIAAILLVRLYVSFFPAQFTLASNNLMGLDIVVGLFAALGMAYGAGSPRSFFVRCLSWKPLAFIGTFSYSVYLVHAPLLQCEWLILRSLHMSDVWGYASGCVIGVPIILAMCYLFFWFCERPFIVKLQSIKSITAPHAAM